MVVVLVTCTCTQFLIPLQSAVQDSLLKCLPSDEQSESMVAAGVDLNAPCFHL